MFVLVRSGLINTQEFVKGRSKKVYEYLENIFFIFVKYKQFRVISCRIHTNLVKITTTNIFHLFECFESLIKILYVRKDS